MVIFGLVSHLVRGRMATEDLSALDICLLRPRGRFFADRPSHVRQFSIILKVQTFHNASAHMWWLRRIAIWNRNRIAVAIAICAWSTSVAFEIHSKSTLSPKPFVHTITNLICLCFLHRSRTGVYFHPSSWRFRGPLTQLSAAPR